MKTLKYILSASISLVFLTACNDSFLEKYPETELNEEAFFQTPEDMAIYLNNSIRIGRPLFRQYRWLYSKPRSIQYAAWNHQRKYRRRLE